MQGDGADDAASYLGSRDSSFSQRIRVTAGGDKVEGGSLGVKSSGKC